jgi:hypothetical protein
MSVSYRFPNLNATVNALGRRWPGGPPDQDTSVERLERSATPIASAIHGLIEEGHRSTIAIGFEYRKSR